VIYVIGAPCIDVMDRACMDECPADAIYAGTRQAFIHPGECIGCGDCVMACPSGAIKPANALPDEWVPFRQAAEHVFAELGATAGGSAHADPVPDPPAHLVGAETGR
jgi:Fe-S-cluster-containing hydrogenase component 2